MPGCFNTPCLVDLRVFDVPGCFNTPWHVELRVFDVPGVSTPGASYFMFFTCQGVSTRLAR
jgi:hypothetical protein